MYHFALCFITFSSAFLLYFLFLLHFNFEKCSLQMTQFIKKNIPKQQNDF